MTHKPFAVGDRVYIAARTHPWHGEAGTITRPFEVRGLAWAVALDRHYPQEAGVAENEIRHMEAA